MGGSTATSEVISQSGVVGTMLENLNGLLRPPVKPTGDNDKDTQTMRERLLNYNKTQFSNQFSYSYHKNHSRPERCAKPDEVVGKDDFVSFPVEQMDKVRYYVQHQLLEGTSLSENDKQRFQDDVVCVVESLSETDSQGWQADEFASKYGDLQVEGMIIWHVIDVPDPSGKKASSQRTMVLSYMGNIYTK